MGISFKTQKTGFTTSVMAKIDTLFPVHAIVIRRPEAFVVPFLIMGLVCKWAISILKWDKTVVVMTMGLKVPHN